MSVYPSINLSEGAYFHSHIRITLQIKAFIPEPVSLPDRLAACCAGWQLLSGSAPCATSCYTPNFAPERQGSPMGAQPWVMKVPPQSVTDGFLCSPEHSKMSFQPLKRF